MSYGSDEVLETRALILMETISERELRLQQSLEQMQIIRSQYFYLNKRYQTATHISYRCSLRLRLHTLRSVSCMFQRYSTTIYKLLVDLYEEMDRIQLELVKREELEHR